MNIDDPRLPRCAQCQYLLVGLTRGNCPECGRPFDLHRAETLQWRPPFNFFTYWLPAALVLTGVWIAYGMVLLTMDRIGWSLTLAVPATIGFLIGYGLRGRWFIRMWLGLVTLGGAIAGLEFEHFIGIFCAFILGLLALPPMGLGFAFGTMLRAYMREDRRFSQRFWLPAIVTLLAPGLVDVAERAFGGRPSIVAQATTVLLHATLDEAWHAPFGDADALPKRSVLHAMHLTRPLEQLGPRGVGEQSTIRLSTGELTVCVTSRDVGRRFAFAYLGQTHVEDRAIKLIDTKFDYASADEATTSLTITTRYQPLMTPRWAWRPFEYWSGEATHEWVGRQMQQAIDAKRRQAVAVNADRSQLNPNR